MTGKMAGLFLCLFLMTAALSGCAARKAEKGDPALPRPQNTTAAEAKASASPGRAAADLVPDKLSKTGEGVPVLKVYDIKAETMESLSVQDYLPAVLAG